MKGIKEKGLHGFFWSFTENAATQGVNFVTIVILARLLVPEYFGLFGISILLTNIALVWIDTGFSYALIREEKVNDLQYNSVFWINGIIGVLLFIFFYFVSPGISRFFNESELIKLIRISALMIPFAAFSSINLVRLSRELDFKTQTKITFISTLIGGLGAVLLALSGFGSVCLVWRFTIIYFFRMLLLWKYSKWMPGRTIDFVSLKNMLNFAYRITVIYTFGSILRSAYGVVIGKKEGSQIMGYYTTAESYSYIASTFLTTTIQKVSYPLLSQMQNNKEMQKETYRRIMTVTMFITFALMFCLAAAAEPILILMVGNKWLPAVPYFRLLCLYFMAAPFQILNQTLFKVNNKSDWFFKVEIIRMIASSIVVVIGFLWGIYPLLVGMIVVAGWLGALIDSVYAYKLIGYSLLNQLKDIFPSLIISLVAAGMILLIQYLFVLPYVLLLFCQLVAAGLLLVFLCRIFRLTPYHDILGLIATIKK